jgi:putative drug exporter of the RND superfamily
MDTIKFQRSHAQYLEALVKALGRFAVHYRYAVIIAWLVVTAFCIRAFPSLSSVTDSNTSAFLPNSAPSVQATNLAGSLLPTGRSSATLVAVRSGGTLTSGDEATIVSAENAIKQVAHVTQVRDQGDSQDNQAHRAQITLDIPTNSSSAKQVVHDIRAAVSDQSTTSGLSIDITGGLATNVDNQAASNQAQRLTQLFSNLVILIMLFVVYRALLAPFLTLIPAGLVLMLAGPIIAKASTAGLQVSSVLQVILTVLLLGAGTDYGLFLTLRVREELRRGLSPHDAVVRAVERVGETITFSAGTVIGALLCLLFATFGIYQGLGPGLAIGVGLMLLAALTLLPALLAIFGRATFWPTNVAPGTEQIGAWGKIAGRIVSRPVLTLIIGVVLFGGLALVALGYQPGGFTGTTTGPSGSGSAQGDAAITAHFPSTATNPTTVILQFPASVWDHLTVVQQAEQALSASKSFTSVSGLLNPNGQAIAPAQLSALYAKYGPPQSLPADPPAGITQQQATIYRAYRASTQFITADGRTVQFFTTLAAGDASSATAMNAIPSIRQSVTDIARSVGASGSGVIGRAAGSYDVSSIADADLAHILPIVLIIIAILLGIVMRSLVAPIYLVASVALSYATSLGIAVLVFMRIGGSGGLNFVLPFLMFIFLMALGEDYNILVMSRIREEARTHSLRDAITLALNATGTTVTSAGLILAATFFVAGLAGNSDQIHQLGIGIGVGILLDTFLVRTLLVPSVVALLGRWNWWPSALGQVSTPSVIQQVGLAGEE